MKLLIEDRRGVNHYPRFGGLFRKQPVKEDGKVFGRIGKEEYKKIREISPDLLIVQINIRDCLKISHRENSSVEELKFIICFVPYGTKDGY